MLEYLWHWTLDVFGQSGVTEHGFVPLSHATIHYWALNHGHRPTPREIRAMIQLDRVLRSRSVERPNAEGSAPDSVDHPAWPEQKDG